MNYRFNVSCSETSAKNWTPTAIDCYRLKCRCSECNLYKAFFKNSHSRCRMKETVIELVRLYGIPSKEVLENEQKY